MLCYLKLSVDIRCYVVIWSFWLTYLSIEMLTRVERCTVRCAPRIFERAILNKGPNELFIMSAIIAEVQKIKGFLLTSLVGLQLASDSIDFLIFSYSILVANGVSLAGNR